MELIYSAEGRALHASQIAAFKSSPALQKLVLGAEFQLGVRKLLHTRVFLTVSSRLCTTWEERPLRDISIMLHTQVCILEHALPFHASEQRPCMDRVKGQSLQTDYQQYYQLLKARCMTVVEALLHRSLHVPL